jgi:hypothetical protein
MEQVVAYLRLVIRIACGAAAGLCPVALGNGPRELDELPAWAGMAAVFLVPYLPALVLSSRSGWRPVPLAVLAAAVVWIAACAVWWANSHLNADRELAARGVRNCSPGALLIPLIFFGELLLAQAIVVGAATAFAWRLNRRVANPDDNSGLRWTPPAVV